MMNAKVGFRRVYIVLHVCWIFGWLSLYLLDWPSDFEHDQAVKLWSDNIAACQSRAQSYDHEELLNNLARQVRHVLPEVPNFGVDDRGLQITTLKDALRECEQRYPFPKTGSGFWREVFQEIRHDSSPPVVRLVYAGFVFFVPTLAYLLFYGLTMAGVSSLRWIRRGFRTT